MPEFMIDFTDVTPFEYGDSGPPPGVYKMGISEVEMVQIKKGENAGGPQMVCTYKVIEGPSTGKTTRVWFPIPQNSGTEKDNVYKRKLLGAVTWSGQVTADQCKGRLTFRTEWMLGQSGVCFIEESEPDATGRSQNLVILVPHDKAAMALAGTWSPRGGTRPDVAAVPPTPFSMTGSAAPPSTVAGPFAAPGAMPMPMMPGAPGGELPNPFLTA